MKTIFSWLSLLASLANLSDVASGQPEDPVAIGKMPGAEVCLRRLRIISFFMRLKAVLPIFEEFLSLIYNHDAPKYSMFVTWSCTFMLECMSNIKMDNPII